MPSVSRYGARVDQIGGAQPEESNSPTRHVCTAFLKGGCMVKVVCKGGSRALWRLRTVCLSAFVRYEYSVGGTGCQSGLRNVCLYLLALCSLTSCILLCESISLCIVSGCDRVVDCHL